MISWKRCKIGRKLVLITNRKSYTSFRLVPKSVTLNDLERRNGRYIVLFHRIWWTCVPTHNRVDLWRSLCTSLLYFVVRARCRRKESSRSLSHLVMSFLYVIPPHKATEFGEITQPLRLLRRSRSFQVTEFCTNRKLICDFLLVINSSLTYIISFTVSEI